MNDTPSPPQDAALDALFTQARTFTPQDEGAAGRFLTGHRQRQRQARQWRRAAGVSALLAAAAAVAGVSVLRPAPDLPVNAAYAAYQGTLGPDWMTGEDTW